MVIDLPIKTGRGLNDRMHPMKRHRLATKQRADVCMVVRSRLRAAEIELPVAVTLTRLSAGALDAHDNLQGAFKATVDGIADAFGVPDNDPRIVWRYAQERCKPKQFGVRVEIKPA